MATMKEIAELAGVSRGTVDRVLNNRAGVNPDTAEEIRRIIREVAYAPNLAGQLLAGRKKAKRLAFLYFDNPQYTFFQEIYHAAQQKADELSSFGITVNFYPLRDYCLEAFEAVFRQIEEDGVAGVVTNAMRFDRFEQFHNRMTAKGVPFVFYNTDDCPGERLCYVGCDYVQAGRVAAGLTALCMGGMGQAAILTHVDSDNQSYLDRMKGFTAELKAHYPNIQLLNDGAPTLFRHGSDPVIRNLVQDCPELSAVYVVNLGDYSVCRSVRAAAEDRVLHVITNDLVPTQREMLQQGIISATLGQQPEVQGAQPIQILYEFLAFGVQPPPKLYTELQIYIGQNAN